jgi:hypothetical protein
MLSLPAPLELPGESGSSCVDETQPLAGSGKRERKRGERLTHKLATLRAQVKLLEQVALALPLVDDADVVWDEFIDDDVKRVRGLLRRLAPATLEIQTLLMRNQQLRMLLDEHNLATQVIHALIEETERMDPWDLSVQRWRALARIHFRPWTADQVVVELEAARQETYNAAFAKTTYTTGFAFMGWEDTLRTLHEASAFQFSLHKVFRGHDLGFHLDSLASIYKTTKLYTKYLLGGRARTSVDIVQEISPHVAIVMYHEQYEGSDYTIHALNLIARVETEDGVTQYVRSIHAPEVVRAFLGPQNTWVNKFYWMQFDRLDAAQPRSACDYRASVRGTVEGHNAILLRFWLFEVLGALVRIETMAARRELLVF